MLCAVYIFTGCNFEQKSKKQPSAMVNIEQEWGVRIVGIRRIANGHMLDFRYKVIEPAKAEKLLAPGITAYLVHEPTGLKLPVPETKFGKLRQTARKADANKQYTVVFANHGAFIKHGEKVSVVIGDFKAEHLMVE